MTDEEILKRITATNARAEKAERSVYKLQGELKQARESAQAKVEDFTLREALRAAGVAPIALDTAVAVVRREAALLNFDDEGAFEFASYKGRTFRDVDALASTFIATWPNYSTAHVDAVSKAAGQDGAPAHDKMSPAALAELGLQQMMRREREQASKHAEAIHKAESKEGRTETGHPIVDSITAELRRLGV